MLLNIERTLLKARPWYYLLRLVTTASRVMVSYYSLMCLRRVMRYGAYGKRRMVYRFYSWRRFLRSSSRSVTVPSTTRSSKSGSVKLLDGRRGGKPRCMRFTSSKTFETPVLILITNKSTGVSKIFEEVNRMQRGFPPRSEDTRLESSHTL